MAKGSGLTIDPSTHPLGSFIINSFAPQQDHQLHRDCMVEMDSPTPETFHFQLSTTHDHDNTSLASKRIRPDEMDFFSRKIDEHDRDHDQSKVMDNASDDDHRAFSRSADLDFNVNVI